MEKENPAQPAPRFAPGGRALAILDALDVDTLDTADRIAVANVYALLALTQATVENKPPRTLYTTTTIVPEGW